MRTLYIHGLDSEPVPEKMKIMKKAGLKPYALHLDYRKEPNAYLSLRNHAIEKRAKFIIGSSLGGFLGFYLAEDLGLPCLLFNPAVSHQSIESNRPQLKNLNCPARYVVLGAQDQVLDPVENLSFIRKKDREGLEQKIMVCSWLEHSIDFDTFEEMVRWAALNVKRLKKKQK